MSSLNWMPVDGPADQPPTCLEALAHDGARFTVEPIHNPDNIIDGWTLTFTCAPDGKVKDLGIFEDAVSAQLHAQQHHDQTPS